MVDGAASGKPSKDDSEGKLNALQIVAATGASATAAVIADTLHIYGTVIGVAVFSIVSSVATALYLKSMHRTRERIRKVRAVGGSQAAPTIRDAAPAPATAGEPSHAPETVADAPPPAPPPWWRANWRPLLASSLIVFVLSIGLLSGLAWLTGRHPAAFYQSTPGPGTSQQRDLDDFQPGEQSGTDSPSPSRTPSTTQQSPSRTPSTTQQPPSETPSNPPTTQPTAPSPSSPLPGSSAKTGESG
jgi:hypothetical protein